MTDDAIIDDLDDFPTDPAEKAEYRPSTHHPELDPQYQFRFYDDDADPMDESSWTTARVQRLVDDMCDVDALPDFYQGTGFPVVRYAEAFTRTPWEDCEQGKKTTVHDGIGDSTFTVIASDPCDCCPPFVGSLLHFVPHEGTRFTSVCRFTSIISAHSTGGYSPSGSAALPETNLL